MKNLTDYGAFVDLGGLDGLLPHHGHELGPADPSPRPGERRRRDPGEVLKFDKEKQRVSLGFKAVDAGSPWLDATERYPVGAQVRGRVLSVTDYGARVCGA